MKQRGRKGGTAITTAAPVKVLERPEPPLELTPEQSDVWRDVVDTMPGGWFTPENHPLLIQYVRHTIDARRIAQLIDQCCSAKEVDVDEYERLLKLQGNESLKLRGLAASMRLAQQARYETKVAANQRAKGTTTSTVKRPWDV